MAIAARLLRNTGLNIVGSLIGRFSNYAFFVMISRSYGVDSAGIFSIATSYFYLGSRFAFWGLDHLLIREVARHPGELHRYLANFIVLRMLLSSVAVGLTYILVRVSGFPISTTIVIMIVVASVLFENVSNICQAALLAFEDVKNITLISTISGIVKILLALLVRNAELWVWAVAFSGSNLVAMVLSLLFVLPRSRLALTHLDLRFCFDQLRVALPFFFVATFFILDSQVDVVLISMLIGEHDVGLYSAALTVITALLLIPQGFRTAVFPIMARYSVASGVALTRIYERSAKYLMLIAFPSTVGVVMLANKVILLVYGSSFASAGGLLQVAVWSYFAYSLTVLNTRMLIVHDQQVQLSRLLFVSALATVIMNVGLVPVVGIMGAAVTKTVTSFLLLLLTQRAATRLSGSIHLWDAMWRSAIASGLMAAGVHLVAPAGLVTQVIVGVVLYITILVAIGGLPAADILMWKQALRQPLARM